MKREMATILSSQIKNKDEKLFVAVWLVFTCVNTLDGKTLLSQNLFFDGLFSFYFMN